MDKKSAPAKIAFFRSRLCRYSKLAAKRGVFCGDRGFLSVRIPGTDIILITPSGADFRDIAPEETLISTLKNASLTGPGHSGRPPDADFLGEAYLRRRNIFAIGHFHPPYATAFSTCARKIPFTTRHDSEKLGEILWVQCATCPSRFAGLCECIEGQRKSYGGVNILLLAADGIVTLGANLKEVFFLADRVEQNARTAYLSSKMSD